MSYIITLREPIYREDISPKGRKDDPKPCMTIEIDCDPRIADGLLWISRDEFIPLRNVRGLVKTNDSNR